MDDKKFIDPRYLEELRKYSASGRKDNDDAMALAMAGQAVFHPDSPIVSIEARSHVNSIPEIPHVDIPQKEQYALDKEKSAEEKLCEAMRRDKKTGKCPYCNEEMLDNEIGAECFSEFGKGYAIEHGDIKAFIAKENGKYYLMHNFTPDDGYFLKMEIHNCPMCGRKLEG